MVRLALWVGRKGVLGVNFIASISQLDKVRATAPAVLAVLPMMDFTPGNKYSDFDPSIDTVAKIGIGGLIAGKVLAKTGLIAVALILLKKFGILLLLPLLGLKKLFTKSRNTNSRLYQTHLAKRCGLIYRCTPKSECSSAW